MIKINLLPPHMRVAKKKKKVAVATSTSKSAPVAITAVSLPALPWLKIVAGCGVVFVAVSVWFAFDSWRISKKLKSLSMEWAQSQPQMQALRTLENEVGTILFPEQDFLLKNALSKASITKILQTMSKALPDGIWLSGFSMSNTGETRSFEIQGLAVDVEKKTTIEQIEDYLQKLKNTIPGSQFTYSTSKQTIEKTSATAFTAQYKWRADQ